MQEAHVCLDLLFLRQTISLKRVKQMLYMEWIYSYICSDAIHKVI